VPPAIAIEEVSSELEMIVPEKPQPKQIITPSGIVYNERPSLLYTNPQANSFL
jgi:hypothetical protein